jgi:hypothetical protein
MRLVRRGMIAGLLLGSAIALFCGAWYARERGMGQDAPFLFAAVLSTPSSLLIGTCWPASGTARFAPWFVALVPPLNGAALGAIVAGLAALVRRRRASNSVPAV